MASVGAVVRRNGGVMLVHRPGREGWTFPAGALAAGEPASDGALRQVREQTGWRCEASRELDATGDTTWWELWARERERWEPNDRVDDLVWVPLSEADSLLPDEADRRLTAAARRG